MGYNYQDQPMESQSEWLGKEPKQRQETASDFKRLLVAKHDISVSVLMRNLSNLQDGMALHHYDEVVKHLLNEVNELKAEVEKLKNQSY
jgi:hypothetical protein